MTDSDATAARASDTQPSEPMAEQNAGVVRRLGSMVYDSLLIFAVLFTATIPALLLAPGSSAPIENGQVVHELAPASEGLLFQLYLLAVYCGFFCFFWTRNGQTLGMQAWRLALQNLEGGRPSLTQCLLRIAAAGLSMACGGLGYWWIWLDKENRSWHDRLTNTRVVVLPKNA